MACVALKSGATVSADELVAHCRRYLAGYKIPRRIEFTPGAELTVLERRQRGESTLSIYNWTGKGRRDSRLTLSQSRNTRQGSLTSQSNPAFLSWKKSPNAHRFKAQPDRVPVCAAEWEPSSPTHRHAG
jgi:hypothetical protein